MGAESAFPPPSQKDQKDEGLSECHINIIIKLYNSLVQPHFDYCNAVWRNCNKGLSEKSQKRQNRAANILLSASYDRNLNNLFRALGWRKHLL